MPAPANKSVIAVDLDEVLSAQSEAIRLFVNKKYDRNHTPEDYKIEAPYWRYFETVWGVPDEEGDKIVGHYISSGGLLLQKPLKGAFEAIKLLKKRYRLVILTSRREEHSEETHQWLREHFPDVFDHVRFTSMWGKGASEAKARISKEIGASYMIDDNLEHCLLAAKEGVSCLLFGDFGWNREEVKDHRIVRAKDWQEVLEYFDEKG